MPNFLLFQSSRPGAMRVRVCVCVCVCVCGMRACARIRSMPANESRKASTRGMTHNRRWEKKTRIFCAILPNVVTETEISTISNEQLRRVKCQYVASCHPTLRGEGSPGFERSSTCDIGRIQCTEQFLLRHLPVACV